jgi:two-component system, LytTR family, sensor histidine kinase AlgZ
MHPLMQGRLRTFLYALIWVGIGALLAALLVLVEPRPIWEAVAFVGPPTLLYASVCLSAWWVCRANPIGGAPATRVVLNVLGAAAQSAAVWVGIAALWAALLSRAFGIGVEREVIIRDLTLLFPIGVVLYGQSLAAHYFLLAYETAREAERRALASQVGAREAELKALRAQINPHFLFNSLNSIASLAGSQPEAARRMCQLLGDFLRTSLTLGGREHVPLREEIGLAERYLAIEQVRFGERLHVAQDLAPAALDCQVPPLIIQPLIENAVKHGVADRVEGGTIRIAARRVGDQLEIRVENPRDPEAPPRRGAGMGLDNVRRRLETLDKRARLDVVREPERFEVALTLPAVVDDAVSAVSVPASAARARASSFEAWA